MGLVALIKISRGAGGLRAVLVCPHEMLQNHPIRIEGVKVQNESCQRRGELLRVAASFNKAWHRTGFKLRFYGSLRKLFYKTTT